MQVVPSSAAIDDAEAVREAWSPLSAPQRMVTVEYQVTPTLLTDPVSPFTLTDLQPARYGSHNGTRAMRRHKRRLFEVRFRPWKFRCIWILVWLVHCCIATFFAYAAAGYGAVAASDEAAFTMRALGIPIGQPAIYGAVVMSILTAVFHAHSALRMITDSLLAQSLVLARPTTKYHSNTTTPRNLVQMVRLQLAWYSAQLDGFVEPVSVSGDHFELAFNVREVIEIAFQTTQAYRLSANISSAMICHLQIAVTVANCWSTALIQHVFRERQSLERFLCILTDLVFTFYSLVIMTIALVIVYYPAELALTDSRYIIAVQSMMGQVLVDSWSQLFIQVIGIVCLTLNLENIKHLAKRKKVSGAGFSHKSNGRSRRSTLEYGDGKTDTQNVRVEHQQHEFLRQMNSVKSKLGHAVVCLYGFAILGIQLHASFSKKTDAIVLGCEMEVRPWFVSDYSCAVLTIDCDQRQINGSQATIADALAAIEPSSILSLTLANCPTLEIPPLIQSLQQLQRIMIVNSTLSSWPMDAALTGTAHPFINTLMLAKVDNLTLLPPGILSPNFPSSMDQIFIAGTHLRELPSNLHEIWPQSMLTIQLEQCALSEFPLVLNDLQMATFSIAGNNISSIPEPFLQNRRFRVVSFGANPLTTLPSMVQNTTMEMLHLGHTDVTTLPQWLVNAVTTVRAAGTPLCINTSTLVDCRTETSPFLLDLD